MLTDMRHCYNTGTPLFSLQKGACGSGIQERNISCLTDEGRPVNVSQCPIDPEMLIMQVEYNVVSLIL